MTDLEIRTRRRALFSLFVLAVLTAVLALPFQMRSSASKGLWQRTESHAADLANYDIRTDRRAVAKIAAFRAAQGRAASQVADIRDTFVRGEAALKQRVPTLKVEYNDDLRVPEVIGTDVRLGRHFLTGATRPAGSKHASVLIDFLKNNAELSGMTTSQIDSLKVFADYTNPDGNLSFVELDQEINGIPVFRGELKAGFTGRGEMVRVVNNLAPGLDYDSLVTDFGEPLAAVRAASALINTDASKLDLRPNRTISDDKKVVFGTGNWATTAEKMYFPTEPGVAVPAWRVLIWQPVNAYYVIVDAATHTMLWRKNITEDQTQPATYSVYANPNAMMNVAHNPFPFSPGPPSPNGAQGAAISRTAITHIGNETPNTFNDLGWLADGVTITDGNAVQAGLDRDEENGIEPNGEAVSASRNFSFVFNPIDPNTNLGDEPIPASQTYPGTAFQQGSVTQLFYICNWYHDETYRLGFTEQSRNFQNDNFGRGGVDSDRVSAEAQDWSGTNNANFGTPADGDRGRMQMYVFTGANPDIDGDFDTDVVIHEHTHGLSNRLHGNGSGLSLVMSRGMGEGWSDFYALAMLSQPSDPVNGIYPMSAYDTYLYSTVGTNNNYYGIRRFPYAVKAFTGNGGRSHNPLTFADIDSSQIDLSDGAFSPRLNGGAPDAPHNSGEIWCSALVEIRGRLVTRLGWETGNRRTLQIVTDGMKLAPLNPTFLTERDAIVAAAQASGANAPEASIDAADVWAGFAVRGIGATASIQNPGDGGGSARVTEAFDLPNLYQTPDITISDAVGNGNGYPEPGEPISINVPLTNISGNTAVNTTLQIVGGGSANYGDISSGTSESRDVPFTVSSAAACGSVITLTFNVNSSLGPISFTRAFAVGGPTTTYTEAFDAVTAPAIPEDWTAARVQNGINFVTTTISPDAGQNAVFAESPTFIGGGTDLTSPAMPVSVAAATLSFRNKYDTEAGWDGGALEISIEGGAFQDIIAAGGVFLQNGYNGSLGANGVNNPLGGRAAWTGDSRGYRTSIVRLPAAAAGHSIRLRFRFGADDNTGGIGMPSGWWIDSINFSGTFACGTGAHSRADFDGDGRTDLSVFRPSVGNWYLQRSTQGFTGVNFGNATDALTPGDFDGDGKTDIAVWRPSTGTWYRFNSGSGAFVAVQFGLSGDMPQAGDFDGDGMDDLAVFRPSNATWYRLNSSNGDFIATQFGQPDDSPVAGDYDGDGKDDLAVYRAGVWYRVNSSDGAFVTTAFGLPTDMATPADYDGDDREDIAVFRPSDGNWYRLNSSNGAFVAINFGLNGDVPVPGDYDGDGKDDQAVYRAGIWYLNRSTSGFSAAAFGIASDIPIPKKYIP